MNEQSQNEGHGNDKYRNEDSAAQCDKLSCMHNPTCGLRSLCESCGLFVGLGLG